MSPSISRHAKVCREILIFCLKVLLFLVVLLFNLPQAVLAHSQPLKLEPTPGARLTQSPPEIRLTFAEPVLPDATISLFLQDSFTSVTGVMAQQDPINPAQIFAYLPPLSPGTYTVQWQIQSGDGHSLSGTYAFSIYSNFLVTRLPWLLIPIILLAAILISYRRRHTNMNPTSLFRSLK